MHLDDGQLRAAIDHASDRKAIDHLQSCADCRRRADELSAQAQRIGAHFAALDPQTDHTLNVSTALARLQAKRVSAEKEIPMFGKIFNRRYRAAWAMVALVALVAVSLTLPPVQTWAQGLLAQFRVSKITVVSVNANSVNQLLGNSDMGKQIGQMLSDSVTVIRQPTSPKNAANAIQANQLAGFSVRLPASRSEQPQLVAQDGGAFQFTVNRARAQKIIDELGASNLKLPASIDGALIKVSIPSSVAAGYGDCPNLLGDATQGTASRSMANCIILTQVPSPVIDAPPDFDIVALAELGLQFGGMSKDQAHAFAQTVDWTSTLVVPIPRNAAQYKKITVDGVEGYFIQRAANDLPQYAIVWVKNKFIYAISGIGNDTSAAMSMANSLKP